MDKKIIQSHLLLHFVVLIYGFTAILGRLITVPATQLVWFRMLIAFVSFGIWMKFRGTSMKLRRKDLFHLLGIGAIVGMHWISFFGAVKISNVSVTLGCMAATTLFTSFLEPILLRRRVNPMEVVLGLLIIFGLYLIFQFETRYLSGIVVALTSAFLAALFTVLNKRISDKFDATLISAYEMLGGLLLLSLVLLGQGEFSKDMFFMSGMDWLLIGILATVCTAFAFAASVAVMKSLSAFSVVLAINLEPVYGIILAVLIFGEDEKMSTGFYIGTIVILLSVFLYPVLKQKISERKALQTQE